jgi:hypothetical protein
LSHASENGGTGQISHEYGTESGEEIEYISMVLVAEIQETTWVEIGNIQVRK